MNAIVKPDFTVLVVGDTHGNYNFMRSSIDVAIENDIDLIIQVGDFGFWPDERDEVNRFFPDPVYGYAANIDNYAKSNQFPVWVIRGNHDWRQEADSFTGDLNLIPGLHFIRDGSRIKINRHTVLFTGGAVSVDYHSRTEGYSWWADEVTSEQDVQASIEGGPVDVWFTHDSVACPPTKRPLSFGATIDPWLATQRSHMEQIFHTVQPKLHVHGHWHCRYSAETSYGHVVGLNCESNSALLVMEFGEEILVG